MSYLLDTHTLIWMVEGNTNLSDKVRIILDDAGKEKFVSTVSFWEMAIKISLGKLQIQKDIDTLPQLLIEAGFELLSINEKHALAVAKLPYLHKDPFDRLLIGQAQIENLTLITADTNITNYQVSTVW